MATQFYAPPQGGRPRGFGDGANPPPGWVSVPAPVHGQDVWDAQAGAYVPHTPPLLDRLTSIIEAMDDLKVAKFMPLIGAAPTLISYGRLAALKVAVQAIAPADAAEIAAQAAIIAAIDAEMV